MDIRFDGKIAIVTGAGSGIGAATARLLAASGATVLVADIAINAALEVTDTIVKAGNKALAVGGDMSQACIVEDLVGTAVSLGGLHCLVNNIGIGGPSAPMAEFPVEGWRQTIEVNMDAVFFGMRYGIAAMLKGGGGSVVNVASALGMVGFEKKVAYVSAKHAVIGMTRTAAIDHAREGIRVNVVAPGFVDTPLLGRLDDNKRHALIRKHPIGRFGKPEEVASLIVFLLSDRANFLTGGCYAADGGYTAH